MASGITVRVCFRIKRHVELYAVYVMDVRRVDEDISIHYAANVGPRSIIVAN